MKLFKSYVRSSSRTRAVDHAYQQYKQSRGDKDICDFCHLDTSASKLLADYPLFMVVTNAFPYATWDGGHLDEHIMLVPKRHVESIAQFTSREQLEFSRLLADYDQAGYSFYGRAAGSQYKSIPHQHVHLMKLGAPLMRHIYSATPYINNFK